MAYPSDLTDEHWLLLEPLLRRPGKPGLKDADLRSVVNGILYITWTGCQWRYLPESFGPWTRVWSQFRRWSRNGTWAMVITALHEQVRLAVGREQLPSMVVIDSSLARGASQGGETFHDRGGPYGATLGAKRVVPVDVTGMPVGAVAVPASTTESAAPGTGLHPPHLPLRLEPTGLEPTGLEPTGLGAGRGHGRTRAGLAVHRPGGRLVPPGPTLPPVPQHRPHDVQPPLEHLTDLGVTGRLELVLVDRGTSAKAARAMSRRFGLEVRRVFWPDRQPVFRPIAHAWRVEVAHGLLGRSRRLAKSFENTTSSATGWLQVACVALLLRQLTT